MDDSLADLEAMFDDLCTDHQEAEAGFWDGSVDDEGVWPAFTRFAAEWLRANRERALKALGAEVLSHMFVTTPGMSGSRWNLFAEVQGDARRVKSVWLLEPGED